MRFIPLLRMALNLKHKLFIPRIFYFISLTSTENADRESVAKGDCICHQLCACLCMCTQTCVCDICLLASYTSPGTKILVPPLGKPLPGKCCCRSPSKLEDQDTGRQPVRGPGPKARADVETRRPGSRTVGTVEGGAWGADPEGARCEGRRLPRGPDGRGGGAVLAATSPSPLDCKRPSAALRESLLSRTLVSCQPEFISTARTSEAQPSAAFATSQCAGPSTRGTQRAHRLSVRKILQTRHTRGLPAWEPKKYITFHLGSLSPLVNSTNRSRKVTVSKYFISIF